VAEDQQRLTGFPTTSPPWPAPPGGFERVMKSTRRDRSRRPYSSRQMWALRLLYIGVALGSMCAVLLGGKSGKLLALTEVFTILLNISFKLTSYQRRQLFGSEPAE